MTDARRWPKKAEEYRLETLAKAKAIGEYVEEAKLALLEEQSCVMAMARLGDIALMAKDIEQLMRDAKKGKP